MAKKITRETVSGRIASALDTLSGRDVAPAIIEALNARHGGETIEADDIEFYVADVTKRMKVSESSARQRGSEVANMCHAYVDLPDAMAKYAKSVHHKSKTDLMPAWYVVARLAKRLKSGDTVAKAVANVKKSLKPVEKVAPSERDIESAMKSAKVHVNRILEHTQLPAKFRSAIAAAATEAGIL